MNTVDVSYVFSTVLTFFIIMLIGAVSRILGVIDWQATKKLSGLVINVTQPLLIIGAFQTSYSADKLKIALSLIGVSAVILVVSGIAVFQGQRESRSQCFGVRNRICKLVVSRISNTCRAFR